ncbi:MAG: succinylglutamate desuccinylase/aspartoacylase family protein [Candidatus Atribacteria bacterium]|nr:succinylglutamate desuccinylase/aspartoacylase family protein [Candidatus Atribacteria bacterium]MBE3092904.1 succinylglutamate desuccinylase/aspartoacylase family protein [Chloroflexota bacterium]MBE3127011.1 succinylglutamate desuccinylase/aspartoacylase family protein [Candidatus Atribacteria bacterium]
MTKNHPPTHFLKVIFIISILLFFYFPQTALLQTTSVEYICAGTDYETPVYIIKTDYKEPTIMVVAGTHGNEKAGIKAAEYLKDNLHIERGTLIIIPKANILACEENVRYFFPEINLNRVYPGNTQGNSVEKLAYEIFSLMKTYDISLLVDLHESIEFYRKNPKNYGQTVVIDSNDDYLFELSSSLVEEMNQEIFEDDNKYQVLVDPVKGSSTYCAYHQLGIPALTFETCRKLSLSFRIEEQIKFVKIIVSKWNMLAAQR